ncbi:MAG: ABC transporter ATP-binding protein [Chloroflexi bacterium]|nr:MAG: ABC transporter ATP-binding protein [Chloroflexota bacterium]
MKTAKVIWRLIAYMPFTYFINTLMWMGLTMLDLAFGLIAKYFFDWLTGSSPLDLSIWSILGMVTVTAVGGIFFLRTGVILDTRTRFVHSALLRRNLLQNILRRPGAKAMAASPGEAISTFRDDGEIMEDAVDWVIDTIAMIAFAVSAIVIMLTIDMMLTLVTILPLAAILLITQAASNRIKRYRRTSREATEKVTGTLNEILTSVQAIQLANAEEHVQRQFQYLNDERRHLMVRDNVLSQMLRSIYANSNALGTGLILILAAGAIRSGDFTLGDFALFVQYQAFLAIYTTDLGQFWAQFKQATVSFNRMVEFLQATAPVDTTKAEIETAVLAHPPIYLNEDVPALNQSSQAVSQPLTTLEINGLCYRHDKNNGTNGKFTGIEDTSFQMQRGSFTVITGRVGSGKTTLLQVLQGLLPLDAGEVRWNGRLITNPANFFTPPHTAYTPQIPQLISMSLRDNLLLGLDETAVNLPAAIHQAVFETDLAEMPDGLDTMVGPKGVRLSGGQIQRTAAARMFVRQPELYIFDDLSSALDVKTEQLLWERLFEQKTVNSQQSTDNGQRTTDYGLQPTCLVVSHRKPALRQADQIVVMKNGRVADIGTLTELLDRCEEMQHLWYEGG